MRQTLCDFCGAKADELATLAIPDNIAAALQGKAVTPAAPLEQGYYYVSFGGRSGDSFDFCAPCLRPLFNLREAWQRHERERVGQ